jgi:hypothetical protein
LEGATGARTESRSSLWQRIRTQEIHILGGVSRLPFQILPDEKFAALVLVRASRADFLAPLDLGGGLWALKAAPFDVGHIWREWIGSIDADRVADANLWFVATRSSKTPEVFDQENQELKNEVWHLFLALLVIGTPYYEGGYILTGGHVDGTPRVRQYGPIHQYLVTHGAPPLTVDHAEIQSALQVKTGLRAVAQGQTHGRLQRGMKVFWRGLKEEFAGARLHQFVRSVEAVVKPEPPRIKRKFVSRCGTFVIGSQAAESLIEECYELRSKEEHLLDGQDALLHHAQNHRVNIMHSRVRQSEGLCRYIYQRVLTSAQHINDFSDTAVDGFWRRSEPDRRTRWGPQLNIVAIP